MISAAPATLPDDTLWNRFAPAALRRALCTPDAGAVDGSFEAAVLLADVSGFTALASRLAQRGAAGPEALSQLLNASFAAMRREVHGRGGEVERLAGDALLTTRGPVMRTWA
jgi:class 3 adenylate cyclase